MCNIKETRKRQKKLFAINPDESLLYKLYNDYHGNIEKWYRDYSEQER